MGLIKLILGGIVIVVCCMLIGTMVISLMSIFPINNDCLEEVAEDYCEDNGMIFGNIYGRGFTCKEDERSFTFKAYKFLDDEIEECKD